MDIEKRKKVIEQAIEGTDMFIVDCTCSPSNDITLVMDSDTSVSIDACAEISRAVESAFDRDTEDFALTVTSAGIGEELRLLRQYRKIIGNSVETLLADGTKILATLEAADENGITLSYDQKVAVEGKKRKELQHIVRCYPFADIKWVREYLDYK